MMLGRCPSIGDFSQSKATTENDVTAFSVTVSSPKGNSLSYNVDATTAQPASDACSTWTITVRGFRTVSGSLIVNSSCSSFSTLYSLLCFLSAVNCI